MVKNAEKQEILDKEMINDYINIDILRKRIKYSDVNVYVPQVKDSDYKRGYINRYLAKRINTGIIVEVSPIQIPNPYYSIKKIKWKLSGPKNTKCGEYTDIGVEDANLDSINKLKREGFNFIENILDNPLQFWRGY